MLVVVKSLLSNEIGHHELFRQEVEMFAKTSHPNLARVLAVSNESQPLLAICEYANGSVSFTLYSL